MLRLVCDEAIPVVALVFAALMLELRVRLGPGEQALEEGELPEHATRAGVGRDDGVVDAQAREIVRSLQAAWPAAHDDHVVSSGRVRTSVDASEMAGMCGAIHRTSYDGWRGQDAD